jgi:hypothetical protein
MAIAAPPSIRKNPSATALITTGPLRSTSLLDLLR